VVAPPTESKPVYDLVTFIGFEDWWHRPRGTPYHHCLEQSVSHIIETGFTGVKTNKYFTLKQYWLNYFKQLGMPIEDTRGMLYFLGDIAYLLAEAVILHKTARQETITSFNIILRPQSIKKNLVGLSYTAPAEESAMPVKPKKKRAKKGENTLESLIGLDNMPALY